MALFWEMGVMGKLESATTVKVVEGEHTRFADTAISCVQFVDHRPVTAHVRLRKKQNERLYRLSINGRDGRAMCSLTRAELNDLNALIMQFQSQDDKQTRLKSS